MHTTRSSADIDIPIYEVSLQSGSEVGIAIVSNENNIPTILAYIPKLSSEYALERSGANALLKETKMAIYGKSIQQNTSLILYPKIRTFSCTTA